MKDFLNGGNVLFNALVWAKIVRSSLMKVLRTFLLSHENLHDWRGRRHWGLLPRKDVMSKSSHSMMWSDSRRPSWECRSLSNVEIEVCCLWKI
jgi:hypothetical protein